jgi:hypothetical protein
MTKREGTLTLGFIKRLNQYVVTSVFCMALVWACSSENDPKNGQINAQNAGTGGGAAGNSNTSPTLRGSCDSSKRLGDFEIVVGAKSSYITGKVKNGVVPSTIETEVAHSGQCKLMRQNKTFCDPACAINLVCDTNGQCIAEPASQSVGTVSVTGLAQAVEIPATAPAYSYDKTSLPALVAEPGASIQLTATGGDMSGFQLYGKGVKPLVISDSVWNITAGQATTIRWEPDSVSGATIMARFSLDQHGTTPIEMECEVEDTGSLVISAEQIKTLMDLGTTVPSKGKIERHTVDSIQTDKGCIELTVYSLNSVEVKFTP